MIGLIMRGLMGGGMFGESGALMCGAGLFSCLAVCGLYKCCKCRCRDCGCCKRCLRSTGFDKFDDFEIMVHVHEALFTGEKAKATICVRVTAGLQTAKTEERKDLAFHESLSIFVEQGVETVFVELMDVREKRVLAVLKLDPIKDLLNSKDLNAEKLYAMKQKSKGLLNPRIRLSVHLDNGEGLAEKGLLQEVDMSKETDMLLRSTMQKKQNNEQKPAAGYGATPSKSSVFMQGCSGPLQQFGSWGSTTNVWVCVKGPPEQKKHTLLIYKDEHDCIKGGTPKLEVPLLKIRSVQPDPGRQEVFIINYFDKDKVKQRLTFCRVNRARDVWVEILTLLIKEVHEEKDKEASKKGKRQ
eukprot:TRINITY_DN5973_c0_g2_i1.p1 TRINITY_DN5973_c0_g2~~TRINITY_DN5973_c0_g2_i1.p1  ORF type:complete len:355 (-),score=86.39 TRINITY_DN5973_c0_g2_i1:109-1173(-)